MNIFFIRNRLQCLIAMKLQERQSKNRKYMIVFLYQKKMDEDSSHVYDLYDDFAKNASKVVNLVMGDGFVKALVKAFLIICFTTLKGGKCFLASIDCLPIVLAMRLCPAVRLETFDDGSANILSSSPYFQESIGNRRGVRRAILRCLFPKGWSFWTRQITRRHHTIYSNYENIVERKRLEVLEWDWSNMLSNEDKNSLRENIEKVVLGTPLSNKEFDEARCILAAASDLYIAHPRENLEGIFGNAIYFKSPAESILLFLSTNRAIKVIHFDSSVGYALENEKNVDFINILNRDTHSLRYEKHQLHELFS